MAAVQKQPGPLPALATPGRFTRVMIETRAGEIEARLSEYGNWELKVRRHEDDTWKLACSGDLDCGVVTKTPVIQTVEETLTRGPLVVDPVSRLVQVDGSEVVLTNKQFTLLLVLASQPSRVFTKAELLEAVWGLTSGEKTRTLDSHASRLRRKLEAAGATGMVVTCWGVGYRLWDRPELAVVPAVSASEEGV
ncbi:MAG: winged helix-turn-helix domain-containing protein [Solirubrobacterales bacterium]